MPGAQKTGQSSKATRDKKKCERYRAEGRREKNKKKKQLRHQKHMEYFTRRRGCKSKGGG